MNRLVCCNLPVTSEYDVVGRRGRARHQYEYCGCLQSAVGEVPRDKYPYMD